MDIIESKLKEDYNKKLIDFKVIVGVEYLHIQGFLIDTEYNFTVFIHKDESYEKLTHKIDNAIISLFTLRTDLL